MKLDSFTQRNCHHPGSFICNMSENNTQHLIVGIEMALKDAARSPASPSTSIAPLITSPHRRQLPTLSF
jgi:hypothetical protein